MGVGNAMMLSTLFVSALLTVPVPAESLQFGMALTADDTALTFIALRDGDAADANDNPLSHSKTHSDTVGSLGRVGHPFEVPVGMRGERQMAGLDTGSAFTGALLRVLHAASAVVESNTQEEQGKPDYVLRTGAVFLASLTVAEIEVTRAVIERGGRELNALYKPFVDHPGALGLVNGGVTGGLGLIAVELNRRGKKTEARVFVWTMVAVKAVVFVHNVRELRK